MLGMGWGEILFIAIVAMVLVGPNKLPQAASQAGRWIKDLRAMLESARADVVRSAGIDEETLSSIADLHPKRIASTLLAGESFGLNDEPVAAAQPRVTPTISTAPRGSGGLDPDAT